MDDNNKNPQTIGEKRVRVKFNPGNDDRVHNLKEAIMWAVKAATFTEIDE